MSTSQTICFQLHNKNGSKIKSLASTWWNLGNELDFKGIPILKLFTKL